MVTVLTQRCCCSDAAAGNMCHCTGMSVGRTATAAGWQAGGGTGYIAAARGNVATVVVIVATAACCDSGRGFLATFLVL